MHVNGGSLFLVQVVHMTRIAEKNSNFSCSDGVCKPDDDILLVVLLHTGFQPRTISFVSVQPSSV